MNVACNQPPRLHIAQCLHQHFFWKCRAVRVVGLGYAAPNWVGGILSTCALLLALASGWLTVSHVTQRKGALACSAS
jgi:DHA1 family inner membrane transport protein